MNKFNQILDLTQDRVPWQRYLTFKKMFYALLLVLSLINLVNADAFYGNESFVYKAPLGFLGITQSVLNLLSIGWMKDYYWFFIIAQIICILASYLGKFNQVLSILVWFFSVNLINRAGVIFTGGGVLVKLLLFYMIFIQEPKKGKDVFRSQVRNVLNNVFFTACLVQVVFVYIFSSWYKWLDPNWISGDAFMYISRIDAYSTPWIKKMIFSFPIMGKLGTWGGLAYQSLFPILIWVKKVKPYFLIIGVLFHLSIALAMGIFSFGMIMIVVYLLFIDLPFVKKIQKPVGSS